MGLADIRVLLALNHALAQHPLLFKAGLFITDKGADLAFLATVAWLWFWRERGGEGRITRVDSRARLILLGAGASCAYVAARVIAMYLNHPRPFATYLPVHGVPGAFEGLRTFGTFPSDHAALLGALPVGFAEWGTSFGLLWGLAAVLLFALRIAVGFHYPSDMLVGALLGMAAAALAMALYNAKGWPYRMANKVARGFSRPPYSYALYAALVLVGIEFLMHFTHVLDVILFFQRLAGRPAVG